MHKAMPSGNSKVVNVFAVQRKCVSACCSQGTSAAGPFWRPSAFPRRAGSSLRAQQLTASWNGFLHVQKHLCSLQSCLPCSSGLWGDSLAIGAEQCQPHGQGKRAGSTGQSNVPWCFTRHLTQAISQLQIEAIVTLVSSLIV